MNMSSDLVWPDEPVLELYAFPYCFGVDSQQRVINGYKLETDVMTLHVGDYFQKAAWKQNKSYKKIGLPIIIIVRDLS